MEISRFESEITSATTLLREGEKEEADASLKYNETQDTQKKLVSDVGLPEGLITFSLLDGTLLTGIVIEGVLVGSPLRMFRDVSLVGLQLAWSYYTSSNAATNVHEARELLDQRRRNAEICKNQIEEAQIELQKVNKRDRQLVSVSRISSAESSDHKIN